MNSQALAAGWCLVCSWLLSAAVFWLEDAARVAGSVQAEQRTAAACHKLKLHAAGSSLNGLYNKNSLLMLSCSPWATLYRASFSTLTALLACLVAAAAYRCVGQLLACVSNSAGADNKHTALVAHTKQHQQQQSCKLDMRLLHTLTGISSVDRLSRQDSCVSSATATKPTNVLHPPQPVVPLPAAAVEQPPQETAAGAEQATDTEQNTNDSSCSSSSGGGGIVDVWVLAGQSNCVGWNQADGQDMPAAAAPWPNRILCWNADGEFLEMERRVSVCAVTAVCWIQQACEGWPSDPHKFGSWAVLSCGFGALPFHVARCLFLKPCSGFPNCCCCCCCQVVVGRKLQYQTCTWACMTMRMQTAWGLTWHSRAH